MHKTCPLLYTLVLPASGIDEGCITYDKQNELSIVWDDVVSFRRKICVSRTNLTYLFGFAVYAIDYDDSDYACPGSARMARTADCACCTSCATT
ncbi:hypothetical protein V5799_006518 [Amblyomma americanum]|uniref:Secreted protein n=1 Tax=Amblyomma americanum TaxID=6943 RepID=A0AAQ4DW60_AMBAM